MRRYHAERAITQRNHRTHMRWIHGWPKEPITCICDLQAGRFRKTDAFDCGQTKCIGCHSNKYPAREPTKQELRSSYRYRDQLREMGVDRGRITRRVSAYS
jgi:hypothetical protein